MDGSIDVVVIGIQVVHVVATVVVASCVCARNPYISTIVNSQVCLTAGLSLDRTSIHLSKHGNSILYCDGTRLRLTITDISRANELVISLISGRASSILIWGSMNIWSISRIIRTLVSNLRTIFGSSLEMRATNW